jgi:SAM-dependent methyltransferase
VNRIHHWLCNSQGWRDTLKTRFPWSIENVPLGSRVLEIGSGFGLTTELLVPLVGSLTCVEIDPKLAGGLRRRFSSDGVRVLCEDAAATSLPDESFDAVVCFTMLHHVSSVEKQNRLLREAARVLRPGGVFAGSDSVLSLRFRLLHLFDTMVVVDAATFPERLESAGFSDVEVQMGRRAFRFRARKPKAGPLATAITGANEYVHH